jgi:hypothetical protein
MTPLTIRAVSPLHATPGNLGAIVEGDYLLLPEPVARLFHAAGVRNGAELLSYLYSFPGAVAVTLHWTLSDVGVATKALHDQLRGHVDEAILDPPRQPKRTYGALYPRSDLVPYR